KSSHDSSCKYKLPGTVSHYPRDSRFICMGAGSESLAGLTIEPANAEFEDVFRLHYARIVRVIARIAHDPGRAEELAADVFWKYLRGSRAHDESPAGWLYRTAVRKGVDELRRQRRQEKYRPLFSFLGIA